MDSQEKTTIFKFKFQRHIFSALYQHFSYQAPLVQGISPAILSPSLSIFGKLLHRYTFLSDKLLDLTSTALFFYTIVKATQFAHGLYRLLKLFEKLKHLKTANNLMKNQ